MSLARVLSVVVALLVLAAAAHVRADDTEAARTHFSAGVKLYDARKYDAALAEFQAAYAAKRSPQIKRNVALCLRGLGRYPEAIDALEEMLAEGGDTLKPDVKEGANQAIGEMMALVGSVRVRLVTTGHTPPTQIAVTVDDKPVTLERLTRPLRLTAGEHVFRATAAGYFDAQQSLKVTAGAPETALDLGLVAVEVTARGRVDVQSNVFTAKLLIDGVEVGTGTWSGDLSVGQHRIEATATGYPPHAVTVNVVASGQEMVHVDMTSAVEPEAEVPQVRVPRLWYVSGGLGIFGESLTPTRALDDTGTSKRSFGGASLVVHGGRLLGQHLAVGIVGEIGGMGSGNYPSQQSNGTVSDKITVTNWVLAPELRVKTAGRFRGFAGIAFGVAGQGVNGTLPQGTTSSGVRQERGSSVAAVGLLEGGGQLDFGRAFLEGALFADVHGVGTVNQANDRYFADSPAVRGGLRILVGYTF